MDHATCKFYNGNYHNTHCEAGVCYRDVTTDPDRLEGRAFRSPCIDWEEWNRRGSRPGFDNEKQAEEWALHGTCDKRQAPTQAEIDQWEAETTARLDEVVESLNRGAVPPGVLVCGPSSIGQCKCNCPDSCEHIWDGPEIHEEDVVTAICSRCKMWQINHDMWLGE